jgi:hypothetical protein
MSGNQNMDAVKLNSRRWEDLYYRAGGKAGRTGLYRVSPCYFRSH